MKKTEAQRDRELATELGDDVELSSDPIGFAANWNAIGDAIYRAIRKTRKENSSHGRQASREGKWQPVTETSPPPDSGEVLVVVQYGIVIAKREGGYWLSQDNDHMSNKPNFDPTHWMPLPDDPKE